MKKWTKEELEAFCDQECKTGTRCACYDSMYCPYEQYKAEQFWNRIKALFRLMKMKLKRKIWRKN